VSLALSSGPQADLKEIEARAMSGMLGAGIDAAKSGAAADLMLSRRAVAIRAALSQAVKLGVPASAQASDMSAGEPTELARAAGIAAQSSDAQGRHVSSHGRRMESLLRNAAAMLGAPAVAAASASDWLAGALPSSSVLTEAPRQTHALTAHFGPAGQQQT